jgi:uncharacterized membrane protein YcaP (DUF421 family)
VSTWHNIWHLDLSVAEKVVRPILIYGFLVVALRVAGKRELGQANTLDLIVILLIANAVQNGIIGNDVSVTGAFIGAAVLFALNEALNRASSRPAVMEILEGTPTYLIEDRNLDHRALRNSGISHGELQAIGRRQGYKDLSEVGTAILETNGAVSMFKETGVSAGD